MQEPTHAPPKRGGRRGSQRRSFEISLRNSAQLGGSCASSEATPWRCANTLTCSARSGLQARTAAPVRRMRLESPASPPALVSFEFGVLVSEFGQLSTARQPSGIEARGRAFGVDGWPFVASPARPAAEAPCQSAIQMVKPSGGERLRADTLSPGRYRRVPGGQGMRTPPPCLSRWRRRRRRRRRNRACFTSVSAARNARRNLHHGHVSTRPRRLAR